jgi:predicted dienelactone hydrolase
MNTLFSKLTDILIGLWIEKGRNRVINFSAITIFMLICSFLTMGKSAQAAEKVYASYSAFERSISVQALEDFAKKGLIDDDLAVYQQYIPTSQLQQLRRVLLNPIKINSVAISQFLYSPQGETLLKRLGEVIRSDSRQSEASFYALRSSLILAASEPGGITLLNILQKYPTPGIRIDLAGAAGIAGELEKFVSETNKAVAAVNQKANTEAAIIESPENISQLPDFRKSGKFGARKYGLQLYDAVRGRLLLTDVYLPKIFQNSPVIVISHGTGSDSSNFEYLATHLASYGFAVVVPNHPGSDAKQIESLLKGSATEVAEPGDFKDRPLDVKYILDELEQLNHKDSRFKDRLNLQQVGVIGQSFGGYTALALGGAKLNFEQLNKDCQSNILKNSWNLSLLLQCRALELENIQDGKEYNFYDERVKAVIALNPITSSVFGEEGLKGIQVPVMIVAGSDDTIAPAIYEQIIPFASIPYTQKYLAVLEGATHFSLIGESKGGSSQFILPANVVGDDPSLARKYVKMMSIPFLETYVSGKEIYTNQLNAAYGKAISSPNLKFSLIQSLTTTELAKSFDGELP